MNGHTMGGIAKDAGLNPQRVPEAPVTTTPLTRPFHRTGNYLGVSGPAVAKMIQKSEARRDRTFRGSMERIRGALS